MRLSRRTELLLYAALTALALMLRFYELGDRPFHHDESQDAYFSWVFWTQGDYAYNPMLHGPLRFYLTALVYTLFGDSDFTARLAPALMGVAMVPLAMLLRSQLGRVGALATAAMLAIGPSYLYYSRFAREDIYIACITLAAIIVMFGFFERPRRWHPALLGCLIALGLGTKESAFITIFIAGTFLIVAAIYQAGKVGPREAPIMVALRSVGWDSWLWGIVAFALTFSALFTVFFTNPSGLWDGIYEGLNYWLDQQKVGGRGEKEWYFYIVVLFAHEWPALLLGAVGAAATIRRPTLFRVYLIWSFLLSLAIYSWASERFSWLVLHPLLPLVLLAAVGVQWIWETRSRAGIVLVILCLLGLAYGSFRASGQNGADPTEFLVTTQSAEDVIGVRDEVYELAERDPTTSILVDSAEGATFPWAWYFRDLQAGYVDLSTGEIAPDTDVVIVTEKNRERLLSELGVFQGREFFLRVWWVREYEKMSVDGWSRWFLKRKPWNETGGMKEWFYKRVVLPPR